MKHEIKENQGVYAPVKNSIIKRKRTFRLQLYAQKSGSVAKIKIITDTAFRFSAYIFHDDPDDFII